MSTLSLTLNGVDFMPQYKTGSAKITQQIMNQGDTCELVIIKKTGQSAPAVGNPLIFKDGTRTLFSGFVTKLTPVEYGIGQMIEYTVEANDHTYLLVNKSAQKSYSNVTLGYIVADLIAGINSSYGITGNHVATGPVITSMTFNHISLRQCFEKLAKLTGYIWWVDYSKDVHFTDPNAGLYLAPEVISDTSANHEAGMTVTVDISQVKNDIIVLGGTAESLAYTQGILGDGHAREWILLYPVTTMTSVKLNGVAKTFGVDPIDDESGFDTMYSPDRGSIRLSAQTTTLTTTDVLEVIFTYPLPVLTEVRDAGSITAMQALEGGDGIHAYTITDTTIVSQDQAQQRAQMELTQFANPILSGQFFTRTGLLQSGSYFAAGQALTVNLPSWGINTNTTYVIQKVVTTLTETGSQIEYHYDVTFGGRLLGVLDFLQALATPETPLDTSGEVQKIQAVAEVVSVSESIVRDLDTNTVSETVTTADTQSMTLTTPPFNWAPSGSNQANWDLFEWG